MLAIRGTKPFACMVLVFAGSLSLFGCAKPAAPQQIVEQPPAPTATQPAGQSSQPTQVTPVASPKPEEVQEAVKRVFKNSVVVNTNHDPAFLIGDFNGDQSQDLAAVLKPAEGKLSELNQEYPSWIAREPLKDVLLPKSRVLAQPVAARTLSNPAAGQTIRFEQNDVLLAIVHGSGPNGWRDPEATQTHLLRGVVGTNLRTLPYKEALKAYKKVRPFPVIYGDLIQQTLIGQSGFLHFTGGIYGWYDPKNYEPPNAPVHGGTSGMR